MIEQKNLAEQKRQKSLETFLASNTEDAKITKLIGIANGDDDRTFWMDVNEPKELRALWKSVCPGAVCKDLDIGDYRDDRYGFVVERKTIDDFISAMISEIPGRLYNRLDEQVLNLHDNFEKPYLIIVGYPEDRYVNPETGETIRYEQIMGKIASIEERTNVRVQLVATESAFIQYMLYLYRKRKDGKPYEPKIVGKRVWDIDEIRVRQLAHIPGIAMTLATAINNHFTSIKEMCNASVTDFMQIPKIGKKKAESIVEVLTKDTGGKILDNSD